MQAILLAGGAGTRLRSVVQDLPKPLAPIAGRPFLSYLLDLLEARGIAEILISVGYMGQNIIDVYGARYGTMPIRYAVEDTPLGTGGGMRNALAQIDHFPVFALNADTLLNLDYRAMQLEFEQSDSSFGMAIRSINDASRYGKAIVRDNHVVAFEPSGQNSQGLINAGVYIFGKDLLKDSDFPQNFSFEKDFLEPRVADLQPFSFIVQDYFIDIGIPEDYGRAQYELPIVLTALKKGE